MLKNSKLRGVKCLCTVLRSYKFSTGIFGPSCFTYVVYSGSALEVWKTFDPSIRYSRVGFGGWGLHINHVFLAMSSLVSMAPTGIWIKSWIAKAGSSVTNSPASGRKGIVRDGVSCRSRSSRRDSCRRDENFRDDGGGGRRDDFGRDSDGRDSDGRDDVG